MAPAPSVSLAMVAARANVSIATASRVLNGVPNRASSETADRVRAAAAELDYRPAVAGQMLRGQPSRLVAVIAADLANPAMAAMAASIEHALLLVEGWLEPYLEIRPAASAAAAAGGNGTGWLEEVVAKPIVVETHAHSLVHHC